MILTGNTNSSEKVIENMDIAKAVLCNPSMVTPEMCIRIGQTISDALSLLKEQKATIEKYREADGFLTAHGWKWDER